MARIARRSLRVHSLPLFSFDTSRSWQSVADATGLLSLRLVEPRHLQLARRILPSAGASLDGRFGFSEGFPPRVGGAGVLAQVDTFEWHSEPDGPIELKAKALKRFRILALRHEDILPDKLPLATAHVQLLNDQDTMRGPGMDGWRHWLGLASGASDCGESRSRASCVVAGASLTAQQHAPVFESMASWKVTHTIPAGVFVVVAGPPKIVAGYLMVPILPTGAVELTLFRETMDTCGGSGNGVLQFALDQFDGNLSRLSPQRKAAFSQKRSQGRRRSSHNMRDDAG